MTSRQEMKQEALAALDKIYEYVSEKAAITRYIRELEAALEEEMQNRISIHMDLHELRGRIEDAAADRRFEDF